jgi:LacI family transcriptional regulator
MKDKSQQQGNLADVAARAGVSKATASRVLNKVGPASEETRRKILQAARDVSYVPNAQFRQLARQGAGEGHSRTGNLGLLLSAVAQPNFATDQYHRRTLIGIEREVQAQDYHLVVATVDEKNPDYLPRVVMDRHVDGLLASVGISPELLKRINAIMPVVLVNDRLDGQGIPAIMSDETSGVRQALDHLRALGHERVTFFRIADTRYTEDVRWRHVHAHILRAEAFERLATEGAHGLPQARLVVLPGRSKSLDETAYDQLVAWREADALPTAILCAADIYAFSFVTAALRLGLRVPRDLSVLGIDDVESCEHVRPKLTSVRSPLEAMGAAAVQTLVRRLQDPSTPAVSQVFDVRLMQRESCASVERTRGP